MLLKVSTVFNRMFKMVSSTDHLSLKTSASPVVNISKNNAAFGAAAGSVTELANGWYNVALTTGDTGTKGCLAYYITGTGADDVDFLDQVVTDLPGDTIATVTNVTQLGGQNVALDANNLLKVDVEDWKGTALPAQATAGVPDVNVKNMNNVAATSITTINANQGTTQPINFTGTAGSALVKTDVTDIATVAVATGTAQLGVNVVNIAGSAAAIDANNLLKVDVEDWKGTALPAQATAGVPDINVKNINNVAAATPGAAGGLFIAGTNAATTINGTAASGATPATAALTLVGGAASTTGGGVAAPALVATGGAGAASTNGAASGATFTAGGTNTVASTADGITLTAKSNGNGLTLVHAGTGLDLNATTTALVLAKTTNITGFNDITAAAAATGVWQDATAGDFTVASSIGKSLYTTGNAPGTSSGLTLVSSLATTAQIATAVWTDTVASDFTTASSIGLGLYPGNHAPGATSGLALVGSAMTLAAGAVDNVALATAGINAIWAAATRNLTGNQGIKKNTALNAFPFPMTDSTNHNPLTGATVTAQRSIDGGAFANCTSAPTETSAGWYQINLSAADLNGNTIALKFTATGADQQNISFATSS